MLEDDSGASADALLSLIARAWALAPAGEGPAQAGGPPPPAPPPLEGWRLAQRGEPPAGEWTAAGALLEPPAHASPPPPPPPQRSAALLVPEHLRLRARALGERAAGGLRFPPPPGEPRGLAVRARLFEAPSPRLAAAFRALGEAPEAEAQLGPIGPLGLPAPAPAPHALLMLSLARAEGGR